jgi:hypothetical protein
MESTSSTAVTAPRSPPVALAPRRSSILFIGEGTIERPEAEHPAKTATALTLAVWLAAAALGVWGWRAGQIGHSRLTGRMWSTPLDLAVGLGIVAPKVAFH